MWRIVMTSLLYFVMVESRPMDPLEGSYWPPHISVSASDLFPARNPDGRSQRSFHQSMYNPDPDYDLLSEFSPNKRAITMFSRWSPISGIGKQRTPIRSNPNTLPFNQIKDRQHGLPLRWG